MGDKIYGNSKMLLDIYTDENIIDQKILETVGENWKNDILYLAEWYRGWGAASGVIWRPTGIKNIKLIQKLNSFDVLS
jgi:hypothetical protein